jgi:hypothetical protein
MVAVLSSASWMSVLKAWVSAERDRKGQPVVLAADDPLPGDPVLEIPGWVIANTKMTNRIRAPATLETVSVMASKLTLTPSYLVARRIHCSFFPGGSANSHSEE